MPNKIWRNRWKQGDISFHQSKVNPALKQYLPNLNIKPGQTILVPLCGKSLDMTLMTDCGYKVLGIEISSIAIQDYFESIKVKPKRERIGKFIQWQSKNIKLWYGDIFDLQAKDIKHISAMYDCASLTAFPSDIRPHYIQHFHERLALTYRILLATVESPDLLRQCSENSVDSEVQTLYRHQFEIKLLSCQSKIRFDPEFPKQPKVQLEEKLYLLSSLRN